MVFVIVHGAWGGGWEWTPVAGLLRERGHDVFTPTLTGLGERAHLGHHGVIGLGTHIADVVAVLEFERLRDVVLCGASLGGMVVTGVADQVPSLVRLLVYVDALVPRDGESALDLLPGGFGEQVRAGHDEHGPMWRVPMPPALRDSLLPPGALPDDERDAYLDRVRDHPCRAFMDTITLMGAVDSVPRAFVRCTASALEDDPIETCAARARDAGWPYRELDTLHDPQIFDPVGIADLLEELATA